VLPQTLFLWPNLLLWAIATALGFFLFASRLKKKITALAAGLSVLGVSAWYCSSYIPDQMKRALTRFGDGAAPAFTLEAVSEGAVSTTAIPGQILVIDFFGTWCPPCIEELPALERIQADLQHRRDIQFVVAATNAGGDTPERLRACAQKRHITLPLAFDPGGKAHAAFGLSGFPGLVVIARDGRVRFTHQGYNTSETSFRSDLTHLLETL
jgi:peroxiredoxin